MRIAISTGGGDAPGLNAVIRAIVLSAHTHGWHTYGIRRGYNGLLGDDGIMTLTPDKVRGITHLGGTILGTTNRGNPFRWVVKDADGKDVAYLYSYDGSGEEGSDLYFNASINGNTYTFTVESYLTGKDTDVYKAVKALNLGDKIDMEGYLFWFEGPNPHIIAVSAAK